MLGLMRRIRIEPEPSRPALALVQLLLGLRGEEARALLERSFFEIADFDDPPVFDAVLYRIADEARGEDLRVDFDPALDATAMARPGAELGSFVVRHREGRGPTLVALIRELNPDLGTPDADEIIAKQGIVQLPVSHAEATRTLERYAAIGGRADIEPLETRWVALPGQPEADF